MDLFESFSGDPENSSANSGGMSGGISRRSIMKAGAAAAWSVPLVQVVAAAPAVAVSGPKATLAVSVSGGKWNGKSANLPATITITNTGSVPTTDLQVTCTFGDPWVSGKATATGWVVQPAGVATTKTYTFTASTQVAVNGTATLAITFNSQTGQGFATDISITATATNSSNAPGTSISVSAAK